ncbi:hypothetical protein [Kitasatospora cineracea]|nr:hypothetical protein [Kitasatospora cineracea]
MTTVLRPCGPLLYLRCFPFDEWRMSSHRAAARAYAASLGLTEPQVLMDNGFRSGGELPRLALLFDLVTSGCCDTVLVPGPWVFSLDDTTAQAVVLALRASGCRLLEVPRAGGGATAPPAPGRPAGPEPAVRPPTPGQAAARAGGDPGQVRCGARNAPVFSGRA